MAEPVGAPALVVLAVGATSVELWATAAGVVAAAGLEPNEPNPPLGLDGAGAGLDGAGAALDWAGADGLLELEDEELEPNEPKLTDLLEDEDEPASATIGLIARARLSIATLSSEVRDLVIGVLL